MGEEQVMDQWFEICRLRKRQQDDATELSRLHVEVEQLKVLLTAARKNIDPIVQFKLADAIDAALAAGGKGE